MFAVGLKHHLKIMFAERWFIQYEKKAVLVGKEELAQVYN